MRRPGAKSAVAMLVIAVMAHGVPGIAGGQSAGQQWIDWRSETVGTDQYGGGFLPAERIKHEQFGDESPELIANALKSSRRHHRVGHKPRKPFVRDYRKVALREARLAGIRRPQLFVRQIAAESGMQPCAKSPAGALGIAQIMPATAKAWRVDPWIPESALRVSARHMARYERQYGSWSLALAAYNAGPGAVKAWGGVPPYAETRFYIGRITDRGAQIPGMRQVYRLPAGMQTGFARRLAALRRDVRTHGGRLTVNEGWRSYEDQLRIWRQAKKEHGGWMNAQRWAAPPGCSNHGRGWAADLGGSLDLAHSLAPRHGLVFPMSHEPWHVELAGIPTQSG